MKVGYIGQNLKRKGWVWKIKLLLKVEKERDNRSWDKYRMYQCFWLTSAKAQFSDDFVGYNKKLSSYDNPIATMITAKVMSVR